jgi:hypothetical protein
MIQAVLLLFQLLPIKVYLFVSSVILALQFIIVILEIKSEIINEENN